MSSDGTESALLSLALLWRLMPMDCGRRNPWNLHASVRRISGIWKPDDLISSLTESARVSTPSITNRFMTVESTASLESLESYFERFPFFLTTGLGIRNRVRLEWTEQNLGKNPWHPVEDSLASRLPMNDSAKRLPHSESAGWGCQESLESRPWFAGTSEWTSINCEKNPIAVWPIESDDRRPATKRTLWLADEREREANQRNDRPKIDATAKRGSSVISFYFFLLRPWQRVVSLLQLVETRRFGYGGGGLFSELYGMRWKNYIFSSKLTSFESPIS